MEQGISSPGPSWAVLSQPTPSSSPSTRVSLMRSDFDVDMDNDEVENELFTPLTPKRKADENLASRKAAKLPRLDLSASQSARRKSSSSASGANNADLVGPSRTQPAPVSASRARILPQRRGVQARTISGPSSSDSLEFGGTLSQAVQRIGAKEKEKERDRTVHLRHPPLGTARKKTCQPKHVRKVTTAALLRVAQRSSDSANESTARTCIRPKKKQLRLNLDKTIACSRPLDTVKNRGEIIELTDSSDAARRPRPSQTLPRVGARFSADPIVITSGSEDGWFTGTTQTQTRRNRNRDRPPASTQSKSKPHSGERVPPPDGVEVISISDSDEDPAPKPAPVSTSTAKDCVSLPTRVSPPVRTAPVPSTSAPAPTPLPPSPPPSVEESPRTGNGHGRRRAS
ncbi:hypothetical protein PAXRUDRAFT_800836 [Paxillus rubicundulus Ve08.2h10]|uniref:Uncharacterized protein n=1 Tax=Paxillus rubicundulus Ve08.2h10 TaxID=930991 RepID=A0A0D0EC04_9AGAM|nr:hypothetical protein PAXRUDRAFT_800836 [Paxillus rubicundulus Ve08.2h10]